MINCFSFSYIFILWSLLIQKSHSSDPYQFHSSMEHPRKILFQSHMLDTTMSADVHGNIEQKFLTNLIKHAGNMLISSLPFSQFFEEESADQIGDKLQIKTWLVQINDQYPITKDLHDKIEHVLDHTLGPYYPHNTFLLIAPAVIAKKATKIEEVAWVGLYPKEAKITGNLLEHIDPFSDMSDKLDRNNEKVLPLKSDFFLNVGLRKTNNVDLPSVEKTVQRWEHDITNLLETQDTLTMLKIIDKDLVRLCISSEPNVTVSYMSLQNLVFYLTNDIETHFIEEYELPTIHNMIAGTLTRERSSRDPMTIYEKGLKGENQIIGVADSGLDYDHCFFSDNPVHDYSRTEKNPDARKILRYHKLPGADYLDAKNGHGTHVVGSVLGTPDMNLPGFSQTDLANIAEYQGSAPSAKVVFQDVGKDGALSGLSDISLGRDLFQVAYDEGARIHSNSWGSSQNYYTTTAKQVDQFAYDNPDFLILVAAGNDGVKDGVITGTVGAPATCKNGLAIGASQTTNAGWKTSISYTDWDYMYQKAKEQVNDIPPQSAGGCCKHSNVKVQDYCCESKKVLEVESNSKRYNDENMADFSSRGPTKDGRVKPEMNAPGQYIISARGDAKSEWVGQNTEQCKYNSVDPTKSDLYSMQGTSMATPVAAGNFALIRQYFLEGYYPSGTKTPGDSITPTASLLKAMALNGAHTLTGEIDLNNDGKKWVSLDNPGIFPIKQIFQGWGRMNLPNSLFPDHTIWLVQNKAVDSREYTDYCFPITGAGTSRLKASLVWTDYPGQVNSDMVSVNNVDLIIGTDVSTAVAGNFVTKRDEKNNIEVAFIDVKQGDTAYVKVKGWKIPKGPQKYALVVSGKFKLGDVKECPNQNLFLVPDFNAAGKAEYFPYGEIVGASIGAIVFLIIIVLVLKYCCGIDLTPCLFALILANNSRNEDEN